MVVQRKRSGRGPGIADKQGRCGQSVVELAILLPLIALILVGAVDLGRAFFYYVRLTDSVGQGALVGSRLPRLITDSASDPNIAGYAASPPAFSADNDSVKYRVKQESQGSLGLTNADITVTCYSKDTSTSPPTYPTTINCNQAAPGDLITVTGRYTFRPLTGELTRVLGSTVPMSKTVRMVIL